MTMRATAVALTRALQDPDADTEAIRDMADELAGGTLRLSYMLSDPDWGVGMLEDVADIVGVDDNPDHEPRWERH